MLNKVLKKLGELLFTYWNRNTSSKILDDLNLQGDLRIRQLSKVIIATNNRELSKVEHEDILKVEKIRNEYLRCSEVITYSNYVGSDTNDDLIELKKPVAEICKRVSISNKWGSFIFRLIREFKSRNCLELGTSLGMSALYQVSALSLNNQGHLTTIEGTRQVANYAFKYLSKIYSNTNVIPGRFDEVLLDVLPKIRPLDFVFIDGYHEEVATQQYFEQILPHLSDQSIVIFDDINWSKGMKMAWKNIQRYQEISLAVDNYKWDICLIDKEQVAQRKQVKIAI